MLKMKNILCGLLITIIFSVMLFGPETSAALQSTASGQLEGSDLIGYGYDVFDKWASPEGVKREAVFDLSKRQKVKYEDKDVIIPQHVSLTVFETGDFRMLNGESLTSYLSDLSSKTELEASYTFYSGSVDFDYSYNSKSTKAYRYTKYYSVVHKYKLQLPAVDELKSILKPQFKQVLETTKDYPSLFKKYGTHFLWNAIIGGRVENNYQTERTSTTEKLRIEACVEASYNNQFGTSGSVANQTVSQTELNSFNANTSKIVHVIGGNAASGISIRNSNDYTEWKNAINKNEKLTLCDFDKESLVGIWELASTQKRQDEIYEAYKTYAEGKKTVFNDPEYTDPSDLCITEIMVVSNKKDIVNIPPGFTKIGVDLNKGSKGNYVYLLAKKELRTSKTKPITKLTAVIGGKNTPAPAGYSKIDVDLNDKAGGDYIYLCYQKGSGAPIRDIKVKFDTNKLDSGYTYITWWGTNTPADMNKTAGGPDIWIEYLVN